MPYADKIALNMIITIMIIVICMDIEIFNPHVVKILIAARSSDSIRAIAIRTGISYGWTYKWVVELEKKCVFKRSGKKVFLNEQNAFYRKFLGFLREAFGNDVSFHYNALRLFGIKYCFTGIDAVFVWTEGGYNIARYGGYYPIFMKVKETDRKIYEYYIKKLGIGGNIFYKPVFLDNFPVFSHQKTPVDSLDETIKFMKKHIYNFQPALEMIEEAYGKKLGIKYKEVVSNS